MLYWEVGLCFFRGLSQRLPAMYRAPFAKVFTVRRQWFSQPLQVMARTSWVKEVSPSGPMMVLWPRPFSLE